MASHPLALRLQRIATSLGIDFFGMADLSGAREFIAEQGGAEMAAYPRSVSVGLTLPHAIVDQLPRRSSRSVASSYQLHAYEVINQRLDLITSRLSGIIQRAGYAAFPVPASRRTDDERLCAAISHKLAAHLAGLGWIGKSCMLITPEQGPRVRWATILTDAILPASGAPMKERCGTCDRCVAACPVQAFTGRPFAPGEPRGLRFDAAKCDAYFKSMRRTDPERAVCGMCLYACPYGQRAASRRAWTGEPLEGSPSLRGSRS